MPWPTESAVTRAAAVLRDVDDYEPERARFIAAEMLRAAGLPEFAGNTEAAAIVGCRRGNLNSQRGLPEDVELAPGKKKLASGRLWLADDVRDFVRDREAARQSA